MCPDNICPVCRHLSISGISQLLLIQFWPSFKCRILEPCLKDANCHGDIYPGNICPYQQFLSCYWSDFDQTFRTQFFFQTQNLFQTQICSDPNFFGQLIWPKKMFKLNIFSDTTFLLPHKKKFRAITFFQIFSDQNLFLDQIFFAGPKFFGPKHFFDPQFLLTQNFFDPKFLWTHNFFGPIFFWTQYLFGTWRHPLETRAKAFPSWTL